MKRKLIFLCLSIAPAISNCFGQLVVTTGGQKYTLLEEATGAWCENCPDGAQWLQEKIEPVYPRVIVASFHDDRGGISSNDEMTLPGNPFNTAAADGGTGFITSFPMGTVDRMPLGGKTGLERMQWPGAVATRNAMAPAFDVTIAGVYNPATRVMQVTVTAKALVAGIGTWRINAYVTEDSIPSTGPGYAQINAYTGSGDLSTDGNPSWYAGHGSPVSPASLYAHMDVVRAILAGNTDKIWGDAAATFTNPEAGDTVMRVYTYTIPTTSSDTYTKVIGLVQKYGTTTADRAVENCIVARVRNMPQNFLKINDAGTTDHISVFPNPADRYITVLHAASTLNSFAGKIVITNSIGQVVFQKEYGTNNSSLSEKIDLSNIDNGAYFLRLIGNNVNQVLEFTLSNNRY